MQLDGITHFFTEGQRPRYINIGMQDARISSIALTSGRIVALKRLVTRAPRVSGSKLDSC